MCFKVLENSLMIFYFVYRSHERSPVCIVNHRFEFFGLIERIA